jgi:hypothetical protein
MEFSHYHCVPSEIAEKVIAAHKPHAPRRKKKPDVAVMGEQTAFFCYSESRVCRAAAISSNLQDKT